MRIPRPELYIDLVNSKQCLQVTTISAGDSGGFGELYKNEKKKIESDK